MSRSSELPSPAAALDERVVALARRDLPLARQLLAELIRIPADYVDRPPQEGGDPACGLSNHEGPRLELLRQRLVELRAVREPEHAFFDDFGNLVWWVEDPDDGIPSHRKRVIYLDGHSDTVGALRRRWLEGIGGGIDAYHGLTDPGAVNRDFLRQELGYLPPDGEWEHLLFGRGSADQLGGVVCQAMATRIMLELAPLGALKGVIVRSYATVAEEDNDGGGPMYVMRRELPGAGPERVPDVIVLTEGTGCARDGALGIYRGQRGRMQIELAVEGRSCHGSMPWEGRNPLEYGAAIVAEAAERYRKGQGFLDHPFLGAGSRTASWARLDTPSDCAVPQSFVIRFDRRLTVGETPQQAVQDVEDLPAVQRARQAGLSVEVSVPRYRQPTWRGYEPDNPQIYPSWETPESHPAIRTAVRTYQRVVGPQVDEPARETGAHLRREPRVSRWVFSTDGVGVPLAVGDDSVVVPPGKEWVVSGVVKHPPMFGIGPGIEQNTHKIGECVDVREIEHATAFLARFPSLYAGGEPAAD